MNSRWKTPVVALGLAAAIFACSPASEPDRTPEARIVDYLDESVREGRLIEVSELVNDVFTTPEERATLDRLYDTFYRIPMFLVQFQTGTGALPTLEQISEQFAFEGPETADVILKLMAADPRLPTFFVRDDSGELRSLDVDAIVAHPQFGRDIERSIAGWEGRMMPPFTAATFEGGEISAADLDGTPYMVYVWFSNCPPCVQTGPLLVELDDVYRDLGFRIVALNADRYLELPYPENLPVDYARSLGMEFTLAYLSSETADAFGGVSIFPTMFFVNGAGTVVEHFVNFQERDALEAAIEAAIAPPA